MANTKISDLPAASSISGDEELVGVQDFENVKITPNQIVGKVPNASDSQKGIVELATNAESITGTDTDRAVTPAGLKAHVDNRTPNATTSLRGLVELATDAEAIAGTSTTLAVTPSGLKARMDAEASTLEVHRDHQLIANQAPDSISEYTIGFGNVSNYDVVVGLQTIDDIGPTVAGLELIRWRIFGSDQILVTIRNNHTTEDRSGYVHIIGIKVV